MKKQKIVRSKDKEGESQGVCEDVEHFRDGQFHGAERFVESRQREHAARQRCVALQKKVMSLEKTWRCMKKIS